MEVKGLASHAGKGPPGAYMCRAAMRDRSALACTAEAPKPEDLGRLRHAS